MDLFEKSLPRTDKTPALYSEPEFVFLDRSARPECRRARQVMEEWFKRYPAEHQGELRQRLRLEDNIPHWSAFFELLLHELLIRLRCEVTIHPIPSEDTSRRPDFLVSPPDGDKFYLEATLATEQSAEDTAANARVNVVYDAINRMESPNFFIGINLKGAPETPPPARRIRAFLQQQLASLDPDSVADSFASDSNTLPRWPFNHDGWNVEFFPIPKSPEARGKPGSRPIGLQVGGFSLVRSREAIRRAVLEKAGRYGLLDLPYVIAVNSLGRPTHREDVLDALFGDTQYVITVGDTTSSPEITRKGNGAWGVPSNPKNTRVSAILLFNGVTAFRIPAAEACLYHNPWASLPYQGPVTRLAQAIPAESKLEWQSGETLGQLFGLPDGWPEV